MSLTEVRLLSDHFAMYKQFLIGKMKVFFFHTIINVLNALHNEPTECLNFKVDESLCDQKVQYKWSNLKRHIKVLFKFSVYNASVDFVLY